MEQRNLEVIKFYLSPKGDKKGKILMSEIEDEDLLKKDGGNFDVYDSVVSLSKWMGYRLDVKSITVLEYRKMIDLFKKENGKENK